MPDKDVVLYVHPSAVLYGSDKVLLSMAKSTLKEGKFSPVVILPCAGPLYDALVGLGVETRIGNVGRVHRRLFSFSGALSVCRSTFQSFREIDRIVAGRNVAIVHSNTLSTIGGAVWAKLRSRPHVWHIHEILDRPRVAAWGLTALVRFLSTKAISVSTAVDQWLVKEQPTLRGRTVVVQNGQPEMRASYSRKSARVALGVSDDDVVVSLVGRIYARKGHQLLISAARQLRDSRDIGPVKFVIVGDVAEGYEQDLADIYCALHESSLESSFIFRPYVRDIADVWVASDICVVPSLQPESFGLVATEAMAFSVPVVATAHGGILDIVVDTETGFLISPNDASELAEALGKLIESKELRERMGAQGKIVVRRRFSIERQQMAIAALYDEVRDAQA